jgi:hypothetical protein
MRRGSHDTRRRAATRRRKESNGEDRSVRSGSGRAAAGVAESSSGETRVLREYRDRCALCGRNDRVTVRHLDGDRTNTDVLNLLPLCIRHDLVDPHDPTASPPAAKLRLFRVYKDPTILGPEFEVLFRRLHFLLVPDVLRSAEDLHGRAKDLIALVQAMKMADYYVPEVSKLLLHCRAPASVREVQEYVRGQRDRVFERIVEALRFQRWSHPSDRALASPEAEA